MSYSRRLRFAKQLRKDQTPWEKKLWAALRSRRFFGMKFKRQVPIGSYIADFCSSRVRIVIELDGGGHRTKASQCYDKKRTHYFEQEQYKVLRFWNSEIDKNFSGVLEYIRGHYFKRPLPVRVQDRTTLSTHGEGK